MDNIYHQYWQQELMYQLASADRCRKRAYICSPFRADTREQREKNLRTARAYMFYANKKMNMNAAAPHAYLPLLLCDEIPAERAIALRFGLEILEQSDVMLVCGNKLSNGMRGEIALHCVMRGSRCATGRFVPVSRLVFCPFRAVSVRCGAGNRPFGFVSAFTYALFDFVRVNACGRFFCPREHVRDFLRRVGVFLRSAFVPVSFFVKLPLA